MRFQKRICARPFAKGSALTPFWEKAHQNINEETIEQARLMPGGSEKSAPLFRWEVSGTIKGIPITLCDTTIPQSFRLAEKGKPRVHFNAGVWAHITLPSDSGMHFRLLDETLRSDSDPYGVLLKEHSL